MAYPSFLLNKPKLQQIYNRLSPEERQTMAERAQSPNFVKGDLLRYGRSVLNTRPKPGQGPHVTNQNMDTSKGIINAASDINRGTLQQNLYANRVNEVGPFGSRNYSYDPASGRWTANYSMSQPMQNLYNQINTQSSTNQFGDVGATRQKYEDAVYSNYANRYQPQFQQEQDTFRQQMANEGITQGSERYNKLQNEMLQRQNDMRKSWQNEAYQAAGQEQQRMFNQQYQQQKAPYENLGYLSQAQATTMRGYSPISQERMEAPDVTGAATSMYQMGPYAAQQHQYKMGEIGLQNEGAMNVAETNLLAGQGGGGENIATGTIRYDENGQAERYDGTQWVRFPQGDLR